MTTLGADAPMSHILASLPTRLSDWRISSNQETFSCGGDEVELSVWNTEQAFAPQLGQSVETETKKEEEKRFAISGRDLEGEECPLYLVGVRDAF